MFDVIKEAGGEARAHVAGEPHDADGGDYRVDHTRRPRRVQECSRCGEMLVDSDYEDLSRFAAFDPRGGGVIRGLDGRSLTTPEDFKKARSSPTSWDLVMIAAAEHGFYQVGAVIIHGYQATGEKNTAPPCEAKS